MQKIFATAVLFLLLNNAIAQVGIGTNSPDNKAILDIRSTTKGLLIPRLSNTDRDAINTPTEGLIIFNTTSKRIETYITGNTTPATFMPGTNEFQVNVGSLYNSNNSTWSSVLRGMGQSFTAAGDGLLSALSINVFSIESASTSSIYELNINYGTPSTPCGTNAAGVSTTCSASSFGEPLATALISINKTGLNKLVFNAPIFLSNGPTYTFTITPTITSQGFMWNGKSGYAGGASFGINGNISGTNDDLHFQTHYIGTGWRAL